MQRPLAVTVLAVLAIIGGLLGIVAGLGMLGVSAFAVFAGTAPQSGEATSAGLLDATGTGLGAAALAIGILNLLFGLGAWLVMRWAWMLGILMRILSVVQVVAGWLINGFTVGGMMILLVNAGLLYYLLLPDVKRAFGRA